MNPLDVLNYCRAHEIAIHARSGMIYLYPPNKITSELGGAVTTNKAELLYILDPRRRLPVTPDRPAHEVHVTAADWNWWMNHCNMTSFAQPAN